MDLVASGEIVEYEDVLREIISRNQQDFERIYSPLRVPDGAMIILAKK